MSYENPEFQSFKHTLPDNTIAVRVCMVEGPDAGKQFIISDLGVVPDTNSEQVYADVSYLNEADTVSAVTIQFVCNKLIEDAYKQLLPEHK